MKEVPIKKEDILGGSVDSAQNLSKRAVMTDLVFNEDTEMEGGEPETHPLQCICVSIYMFIINMNGGWCTRSCSIIQKNNVALIAYSYHYFHYSANPLFRVIIFAGTPALSRRPYRCCTNPCVL
jgi:hypothetical protein